MMSIQKEAAMHSPPKYISLITWLIWSNYLSILGPDKVYGITFHIRNYPSALTKLRVPSIYMTIYPGTVLMHISPYWQHFATIQKVLPHLQNNPIPISSRIGVSCVSSTWRKHPLTFLMSTSPFTHLHPRRHWQTFLSINPSLCYRPRVLFWTWRWWRRTVIEYYKHVKPSSYLSEAI